MTRAEVLSMAAEVRELLGTDGLLPTERARWEGALTALEAVAGEPPTLAFAARPMPAASAS